MRHGVDKRGHGKLGEMGVSRFLREELAAAATIALGYFGKVSAVVKGGDSNQVLTEADIAIGAKLVEAVRSTYPSHNVIDEEAGVIDNGSRYTWVIDPIEATSNFAAGIPEYGIMMGLLEDALPVAGGIVVPEHRRFYSAERGRGATVNGRSITVTEARDLNDVLVSFGFDGNRTDPVCTVRECRILAEIALICRGTVNSGCEAVDPMLVAEGRLGGRVNMASKIWDNIAPHIIAEEAGAVWSAADGTPIDYSHPTERTAENYTFCVAPPALHRQLTGIVRRDLG